MTFDFLPSNPLSQLWQRGLNSHHFFCLKYLFFLVSQSLAGANLGAILRLNTFLLVAALFISLFLLQASANAQDRAMSAPLSDASSSNDSNFTLTQPALDYYQGKAVQASPEWVELEMLRIKLYARQGQWADVVERIEHWPAPGVEHELLPIVIRSYLNLKEPVKAREQLMRMLWSETEAEPQSVMAWRRDVIRSYLMEGRYDDAHTAMLRYRQDYADQSTSWLLLHAEILFALERYLDIPVLLAEVDDPHAQLLTLMAKRLDASSDLALVQKKAMQHVVEYSNSDPLAVFQFAVLAADIAQMRKDYLGEVENLELAFSIKEKAFGHFWLNATADRLWSAYANYARELGNQAQLIIGDFDPWLVLAHEWLSKEPMQARALLAFVISKAQDPEVRVAAHQALIKALTQIKDGEATLTQLYLNIPTTRTVP